MTSRSLNPRFGGGTRTLSLVICLGLLACPFGDAYWDFEGQVHSSDGKPIAHALAWVEEDSAAGDILPLRTQTDSLGNFHYRDFTAPLQFPVVVSINRPGYKPFRWQIPNRSALALNCIVVVLEPVRSAAESRLVAADSSARSPGSWRSSNRCSGRARVLRQHKVDRPSGISPAAREVSVRPRGTSFAAELGG